MSQSTKLKLANTLEALLQKIPIEKITISDIVEAVDTFWKEENFCQAFSTATTIMQQHKTFYQQIVRKEGINSFQRLFAQGNIELSKIRIQNVSGKDITSTLNFLLELYWFGAAQVLVNWIADGMKDSPARLASLLYEGLPLSLRQYWPK